MAGRGLVLIFALIACAVPSAPPVASSYLPGPEERAEPVLARPLVLGGGLEAFSFVLPLDRFGLEVIEVGLDRTLDEVRRRGRASVAVNGGFFDEGFFPEGLVVTGGRALSPLAPELSGGVLAVEGGRARLIATEDFTSSTAMDFAIQCRPRLVVCSRNNLRSDTGRRAARTAICIVDEGRTLVLVVAPASRDEGPTLYELADALVRYGCSEALNLDGGPSTGAAWRAADAAWALEPRGPVRQAVIARGARSAGNADAR